MDILIIQFKIHTVFPRINASGYYCLFANKTERNRINWQKIVLGNESYKCLRSHSQFDSLIFRYHVCPPPAGLPWVWEFPQDSHMGGNGKKIYLLGILWKSRCRSASGPPVSDVPPDMWP